MGQHTPADLVPRAASSGLVDSLFLQCLHVAERVLASLLITVLTPSRVPTLMISSNHNYLPKAHFQNNHIGSFNIRLFFFQGTQIFGLKLKDTRNVQTLAIMTATQAETRCSSVPLTSLTSTSRHQTYSTSKICIAQIVLLSG